MIKNIQLHNFRGFSDHLIEFKDLNIIVGANNAGKSTIVEALGIISTVTNRFRNLPIKNTPEWLSIGGKNSGFSPSLKDTDLNYETMFYHYQDPPALLRTTFSNNIRLDIYLGGENKIFGIFYDSSAKMFRNKTKLLENDIPYISILPQVGPVRQQEEILTPEYVRSAMNSEIGFTHFRNQLFLYRNLFETFQKLVSDSWPGVIVTELINEGKMPKDSLYLHIRNEEFVAEVSNMGHGLQMWLQTMWFLTRSKDFSVVILDEPDVYMHADLQRKLIRLLKNLFPQIIITTHSIEIVSEVDPENILIVDKHKNRSVFASKIPEVQNIINRTGSIQNIHLTKLWRSKKFIIVEGKDIKYLKILQNKIFPKSTEPFDSIPHMSIGGWGGWNYAVGSSFFVKNSFGEAVINYCIFDKDYHTEKQLTERISEGITKGVQVHIWSKKEIENYFVIPSAIARVINSRIAKRTTKTNENEVKNKIDAFLLELEENTFDSLSTEINKNYSSINLGTANKQAREIIKATKKQDGNILSLVSGKELFTLLSDWSQNEFSVSFSPSGVVNEIMKNEIDAELINVISKIEKNELF
ncbi:MAG: ATP-dependent endonuclease [Ignavibacteria bacterium]|nr:MAG: ATP-dependent endonuclease [Ignavibacteria bacterium]KAF0154716.1 MAG: ATP-dependent endonuclease [Ignavibacteria bacterium]